METLASSTKCKRRKTRKCLDELRKRSRRNINGNDLLSPEIKKVNLNIVKRNNAITANRLTLAMFPKAVQSETATRPPLCEMRQESVENFNKIRLSEQPLCTVTSSSLMTQPLNSDKSEGIIHNEFEKCNNIGLQNHSGSDNLTNCDNSPGSFILFSTKNDTTETDLLRSDKGETGSTLTTPSQSYREDYGYHLYEEFMNEIPTYLEQNAPALIKDDVMKETKQKLHNFYIEGCRRECVDNVLQCIRNRGLTHRPFAPRREIVQNPMEYIRLSYYWQSATDKLDGTVADSGDSGSGSPHSPTHSFPEYTYHPHKLNQ